MSSLLQLKKDCRPLTTPTFQNKRLKNRIHRYSLTAAVNTTLPSENRSKLSLLNYRENRLTV